MLNTMIADDNSPDTKTKLNKHERNYINAN